LFLIDEAFLAHHDNFYQQVQQLDKTNRKLSKRFFFAFNELYHQSRLFGKQLKFFYFWRLIHILNDLLIYGVTEANLNKFTSDVVNEWKMLDKDDREHFTSLYPEVVERIRGILNCRIREWQK
jgi:mRNA-degrading endonuclease RelE of RelBE toxin-antitoxin system